MNYTDVKSVKKLWSFQLVDHLIAKIHKLSQLFQIKCLKLLSLIHDAGEIGEDLLDRH